MVKLGTKIMTAEENIAIGASHGSDAEDVYKLARDHSKRKLSAAYCPNVSIDDKARINDIRQAFSKENIVIAEVGGWKNMLHPNPQEAKQAREQMAECLCVADEVGALCTITCIGTGSSPSMSAHSDQNFFRNSFEAAVENARWLVDTVNPKRASFVYEIYPFSVADSVENVKKLIEAVDRPKFGAHMDLVNLINSPRLYYSSTYLAREFVRVLGKHIVSAHAKDLIMEQEVSVIMREVRPGLGVVDYPTYLKVLNELPQDVPLLIEHLESQEEYDKAARYIQNIANKENIKLR